MLGDERMEQINNINSREDFIAFLHDLKVDNCDNETEWYNKSIKDYLESIGNWVEDMDGYYSNMKIDMPENINWSFIATLFYVGKIYE